MTVDGPPTGASESALAPWSRDLAPPSGPVAQAAASDAAWSPAADGGSGSAADYELTGGGYVPVASEDDRSALEALLQRLAGRAAPAGFPVLPGGPHSRDSSVPAPADLQIDAVAGGGVPGCDGCIGFMRERARAALDEEWRLNGVSSAAGSAPAECAVTLDGSAQPHVSWLSYVGRSQRVARPGEAPIAVQFIMVALLPARQQAHNTSEQARPAKRARKAGASAAAPSGSDAADPRCVVRVSLASDPGARAAASLQRVRVRVSGARCVPCTNHCARAGAAGGRKRLR